MLTLQLQQHFHSYLNNKLDFPRTKDKDEEEGEGEGEGEEGTPVAMSHWLATGWNRKPEVIDSVIWFIKNHEIISTNNILLWNIHLYIN